ncbi:hypothetical protein K438DRAFT_1956975 [Mycena galopus ATCC 62051]|nr:hypothetical protein K438DRAFT_1956975 [Mycena galopus ATCC 62051]
MSHQDPPFPSISLVLSQSTQPSYLVFPWTPVSYPNPANIVPAPVNVAPPQPLVGPTPSTLSIILRALRQFFANIFTSLKAWIAS